MIVLLCRNLSRVKGKDCGALIDQKFNHITMLHISRDTAAGFPYYYLLSMNEVLLRSGRRQLIFPSLLL